LHFSYDLSTFFRLALLLSKKKPMEMITMTHKTHHEEEEDLEASSSSPEVDLAQMSLPELPLLVELKELCYEVSSVAIPSKNFLKPPTASKKVIFQNINLQVIPGELLAIMGPTGCGKVGYSSFSSFIRFSLLLLLLFLLLLLLLLLFLPILF
jgi:ABC-type multidrug transport system fused ATPase/permease subunit